MSGVLDTAAPTVLELNAITTVDISCYLTAGGYAPSLSEQVATDERLCSTQTYEQPGRSARGLELTYIDNTNDPTNPNDAKETLVPGANLFIGVRRGLPFAGAFVAAEKVWVQPIKPGQYNDLPPEANSVLKTSQKQFITGATSVDVAVV